MKSKEQEGFFPKETCEAVRRGQNGYCMVCTKKIDEFHHRVANTATNRKLFPVFISSIFNCVGLCRTCHIYKTNKVNITEDMAREYEQALQMIEIKTLQEIGGKE